MYGGISACISYNYFQRFFWVIVIIVLEWHLKLDFRPYSGVGLWIYEMLKGARKPRALWAEKGPFSNGFTRMCLTVQYALLGHVLYTLSIACIGCERNNTKLQYVAYRLTIRRFCNKCVWKRPIFIFVLLVRKKNYIGDRAPSHTIAAAAAVHLYERQTYFVGNVNTKIWLYSVDLELHNFFTLLLYSFRDLSFRRLFECIKKPKSLQSCSCNRWILLIAAAATAICIYPPSYIYIRSLICAF